MKEKLIRAGLFIKRGLNNSKNVLEELMGQLVSLDQWFPLSRELLGGPN